MHGIIFNFVAALLSVHTVQVFSQPETYRGAVVEYSPVTRGTDKLIMEANVQNYVQYMAEAAKKEVDIIVFPEKGLAFKELSPIPDPVDRIAPCDNPEFVTTEAVKKLSLASKSNKIYSVVNLSEKRKCASDDEDCPPNGFYSYNTNVVFDRHGVVIARYAKYNLFDESGTNHSKDPELVFFDTDFGVRFGIFICFDILFSTPAQKLVQQYRIKDFVFSTYWFSELPFLTALQVQRGWAETNDVNLLASGINSLSEGSTGSGIYNGKFGHLVQFMPRKTQNKLLIADIPKFDDRNRPYVYERKTHKVSRAVEDSFNSSHFLPVNSKKTRDTDDPSLNLLKDQIDLYTSEVIEAGKVFEKRVCTRRDFCCDFYVDMDALMPESSSYFYRAMVFSGVRRFGQSFRGGVQSCGVVLCDGPDIMNCTSRVKNITNLFKFRGIKIKGNFKLKNSFQFPSTLTDGNDLLPLPANKYEFIKTKEYNNLEVSLELIWPVFDLHTFAIWGRDFTRDMEPNVPESGASTLVSAHVLFITFLAFNLFAR